MRIASSPTKKINITRISSICQSAKNPFQRKEKLRIDKLSSSCKCNLREFTNYKHLAEESPEDCHHSIVKYPSEANVIQKKKLVKKSTHEMEDMLLEIQLGTMLSLEMEKELMFIRTINRITLQEISDHHITLPDPKRKFTIFLDLDETLIYTLRNPFGKESCLVAEAIAINYYSPVLGALSLAYFKPRPFLKEFLKSMSKHFEIIVYSFN